jgi:hypothetical protein
MRRMTAGDFGATGNAFAVGRAFEKDRKRSGHYLPGVRWTVDITGQLDPITHGDFDIALDQDFVVYDLTCR